MGMYTDVIADLRFSRHTPPEIIEGFQTMLAGETRDFEPFAEHEFFECERWRYIFFEMSSIAVNAAIADIEEQGFKYSGEKSYWVDTAKHLYIFGSIKAYDMDYTKFRNFIMPFLKEAWWWELDEHARSHSFYTFAIEEGIEWKTKVEARYS